MPLFSRCSFSMLNIALNMTNMNPRVNVLCQDDNMSETIESTFHARIMTFNAIRKQVICYC